MIIPDLSPKISQRSENSNFGQNWLIKFEIIEIGYKRGFFKPSLKEVNNRSTMLYMNEL